MNETNEEHIGRTGEARRRVGQQGNDKKSGRGHVTGALAHTTLTCCEMFPVTIHEHLHDNSPQPVRKSTFRGENDAGDVLLPVQTGRGARSDGSIISYWFSGDLEVGNGLPVDGTIISSGTGSASQSQL